jgi:hypothetical protein
MCENYADTWNPSNKYPSFGSVTASAQPLVDSRQFLAPPDRLFPIYRSGNPGDVLRQATWNAATESWDNFTVPPVPLQAAYDNSTGQVSVVITFGATFNADPSNVLIAGASPRWYGYSVTFNGLPIVNGVITISDFAPPQVQRVEACGFGIGGAAGAAPSGGPWLAGV